MGEEILKPWQRQAIAFLAQAPAFVGFYLTGGTALAAYYLRHRISDDLDFFSRGEVDAAAVHALAKELGEALPALVRDVREKFGMSVDPLFLGSELHKAERIAALPRMIKPLAVEELKEFFRVEAQQLKPQIIE